MINLISIFAAAASAKDAKECGDFISIDASVTNQQCVDACGDWNGCVSLADQPECYGDWVYGYSEEYGKLDDYENRWDNLFHWTEVMDSVDSTPQDCQAMCQADEGCGFFAFREDASASPYAGDADGKPICVMKSRESVVKSVNQKVTLDTWNAPSWAPERQYCNMNLGYDCNTDGHYDCKLCDGDAVCAWRSYYHISGPKFCGQDEWMESDEICPDEGGEGGEGGDGGDATEEPEKPSSGPELCDDPLWRNPSGDNSQFNHRCIDMNFASCQEAANHVEVQQHCTAKCTEMLAGSGHELDASATDLDNCSIVVPEKKTDCCDDPDFKYQNSPCRAQMYNCNVDEVMEHCPMTCQKDTPQYDMPWNEASDAHCYDWCQDSSCADGVEGSEPYGGWADWCAGKKRDSGCDASVWGAPDGKQHAMSEICAFTCDACEPATEAPTEAPTTEATTTTVATTPATTTTTEAPTTTTTAAPTEAPTTSGGVDNALETIPRTSPGIDNGLVTITTTTTEECGCKNDCDCDCACKGEPECECESGCSCSSLCDCAQDIAGLVADVAIVGLDSMNDTIGNVLKFVAVEAEQDHDHLMGRLAKAGMDIELENITTAASGGMGGIAGTQ